VSDVTPRFSPPRPARVGFGYHLLATLVDSCCGLVLGHLAASTLGGFFVDRAVATLHIGQPDTIWKGPLPLALGLFGNLIYALPFVLSILWLSEPLFGASPGKQLLRIEMLTRHGGVLFIGDRWRRYLLKTGGLWLMVVGLLFGNWQLLLAGAVGTVILWLGGLVALIPPGDSLLDSLAHAALFRGVSQREKTTSC